MCYLVAIQYSSVTLGLARRAGVLFRPPEEGGDGDNDDGEDEEDEAEEEEAVSTGGNFMMIERDSGLQMKRNQSH